LAAEDAEGAAEGVSLPKWMLNPRCHSTSRMSFFSDAKDAKDAKREG